MIAILTTNIAVLTDRDPVADACGSLGGKIPQAARYTGPRGSIGGKARQPSIGGSGLMRPGLSRSNTVSGLERRISQHGYDAVGRSTASPCPAPVKRRESSPGGGGASGGHGKASALYDGSMEA